jgi:hypothetical protein
MAFEEFVALVGFLAVVYAVLVKFVQSKLIDRKEMEDIQAESRRLGEEFDKAKKANNKKKMDEIMERQMEFLPKMNSMMFKQFRPMIVILVIFFAFTWALAYVDPTVKDDIFLNLSDNGKGCDLVSGDGNFTACYVLNNTNYGKWTVLVKAMDGTSEQGRNSIFFLYGSNVSDNYSDGPKGQAVEVSTDKRYYSPGDTVRVYASTQAAVTSMEAELDNGTSFRVDLPFTIPIINVQRIQQPYWWFIFISLITNLALSFGMGQIDRMRKGRGVGK